MSDHFSICLDNGNSHIFQPHMFKFKAYWLNQKGYSELMAQWWNSFSSDPFMAQLWKLKLEHLRLKLKGWNANLNKHIRDNKAQFFSSITYEIRELSDDEYISFLLLKMG
jgi:hypothetical protein